MALNKRRQEKTQHHGKGILLVLTRGPFPFLCIQSLMWQWKESKFWITVVGSLVDLQGAEGFWRSRVLHKVTVAELPAHSWSVGRFLWMKPRVESCSEQYANPWSTNKMLDLDKTHASTCRPGLFISHPHPPSKFGISVSRCFFHGIRDQKGHGGGMKMSPASCLFWGSRCNHAL